MKQFPWREKKPIYSRKVKEMFFLLRKDVYQVWYTQSICGYTLHRTYARFRIKIFTISLNYWIGLKHFSNRILVQNEIGTGNQLHKIKHFLMLENRIFKYQYEIRCFLLLNYISFKTGFSLLFMLNVLMILNVFMMIQHIYGSTILWYTIHIDTSYILNKLYQLMILNMY